jgi:hypothetical protein
MTATSGRTLLGLYENLGRVGPLAKMLLGMSRWASTKCYLTWRDLATPGRRLLFRLSPSMPSTKETGHGLWLTPTATERRCSNVAELVWTKNGTVRRAYKNKTSALGLSMQAGAVLGNLNPQWVEWLMGYPIGWTDLQRSETQSSRKSRKKSFAESKP